MGSKYFKLQLCVFYDCSVARDSQVSASIIELYSRYIYKPYNN